MTYLIPSLRFLILMSVLTGLLYPLAMKVIGRVFFDDAVAGSLIRNEAGDILGSKLISQKFENNRYFHSRPSAGDFATVASGASNLGPTSQVLREQIKARKLKYGDNAPVDLLTSSGSGLDPHLSLDAVQFQIDRVMKARGLLGEKKHEITKLIANTTVQPIWGFIGVQSVNVLELNVAMDKEFK